MKVQIETIQRFIKDESFSGILLFIATLSAVVVANFVLGDAYFKLWDMSLGIGFTMSIFITQLAFLDATMIDAVKLGIFIASFIAGVIGVMLILRASKKRQGIN